MSCELECDDLNNVGFEELVRKMVVKTEDGCFALRVIDEGTGGGGGSYTFPTNHGNTAYVATGGNDGTGTVGNISKPFETLQAAINALDSGSAGQVIILSSGAFGQSITSLAMGSTHPYVVSIKNMTDLLIDFNGTGSYDIGQLSIDTPANVQFNITGGGTLVVNDYMNIRCNYLFVPNTHNCDISHIGIIDCNAIIINANSNNPTLAFDIINWKYSCSINEPITYTKCNPMTWKALVTQAGTANPIVRKLLENTMGETLTFTRSSDGTYSAISPGNKFTENTGMKLSAAESLFPFFVNIYIHNRVDESEIVFQVYDAVSFALLDNLGTSTGTLIEIEVYP